MPPLVAKDFVDHFMGFVVFGVLLAKLFSALRPRKAGAWVLAAVVGVCFGTMAELGQTWVPGRDVQFSDWAANASGVLVGIGLALLVAALMAGLRFSARARGGPGTKPRSGSLGAGGRRRRSRSARTRRRR